jgi:hypothetical protein
VRHFKSSEASLHFESRRGITSDKRCNSSGQIIAGS